MYLPSPELQVAQKSKTLDFGDFWAGLECSCRFQRAERREKAQARPSRQARLGFDVMPIRWVDPLQKCRFEKHTIPDYCVSLEKEKVLQSPPSTPHSVQDNLAVFLLQACTKTKKLSLIRFQRKTFEQSTVQPQTRSQHHDGYISIALGSEQAHGP